MQFKDNFNETLLLVEQPVLFYADDPYLIQNIDFKMKMLTLADTLTNPYIQIVLTLFNLQLSDLHKAVPAVQFNTLWELLIWLLQNGGKDQFSRAIQTFFSLVFGNRFHIQDNYYYIDDIEIDEKLFSRIQTISLVSAGIIDFNDQPDPNKPQWLLEKEATIKRIKAQNSNKTGNSFQQLMQILMPLHYELHYTFEQLFNMNYFHIKILSSYIPKIISYDIQKRQIMAKKPPKYITEK